MGPAAGAAGGGGEGDAVGLEGGEGILPGVEDLGGEGPPRAALEEEAGTAGRAVHEKSGKKIRVAAFDRQLFLFPRNELFSNRHITTRIA